jgi:hypothetical protein
MGKRGRYVYTPLRSGWIVIKDVQRRQIESTHCPDGDAQERYEKMAEQLELEGWIVESRFGDWRSSTVAMFAITFESP